MCQRDAHPARTSPRRRAALLVALAASLGLNACGLKGPLYLPQPEGGQTPRSSPNTPTGGAPHAATTPDQPAQPAPPTRP
ncbi:hypothetical protein GTZ97_03345 [Aquabacterium fontiphilum]|nr:hypothetical protein [Aquabacterium fontiphilum]